MATVNPGDIWDFIESHNRVSGDSSLRTPYLTADDTPEYSINDDDELPKKAVAPTAASSAPLSYREPVSSAKNFNDLTILWCEFQELLGCNHVFRVDDARGWIDHHVAHFGHKLPSRLVCWFCDHSPFESIHSADRQSNFEERMIHIRDHIVDDFRACDTMRPDFFVIKHLYKYGRLDHQTYLDAVRYSELPPELWPDTKEEGRASYTPWGGDDCEIIERRQRRKRGKRRYQPPLRGIDAVAAHGPFPSQSSDRLSGRPPSQSADNGADVYHETTRWPPIELPVRNASLGSRAPSIPKPTTPIPGGGKAAVDRLLAGLPGGTDTEPTQGSTTHFSDQAPYPDEIGREKREENDGKRSPATDSNNAYDRHQNKIAEQPFITSQPRRTLLSSNEMNSPSPDSLDSELFSDSDDTLFSSEPDPQSPISAALAAVANRMVRDFLLRNFLHREVPESSGADRSNNSGVGSSSQTSCGDHRRSAQKRRNTGSPFERGKGKGGEGEQDGDGDTPRNPDKKRRATDGEPASHRTLACPFWKYDPYTKYRSCGAYTLKRIRDVKQHLTRRHTPTLYCQVCYVIFQERDRLEEHIETRSCSRAPGSQLDGISPTTDRILRGRANPKLSTEEQWFDIWSLLFPDKPRPFSPYNDPVLSADIGDFREYWQNHSHDALDDIIGELESNGEVNRQIHARRILVMGINRIYNDFMASQEATPSPDVQAPPPAPSPASSPAAPAVPGLGPEAQLFDDWNDDWNPESLDFDITETCENEDIDLASDSAQGLQSIMESGDKTREREVNSGNSTDLYNLDSSFRPSLEPQDLSGQWAVATGGWSQMFDPSLDMEAGDFLSFDGELGADDVLERSCLKATAGGSQILDEEGVNTKTAAKK